MKIYRPIMTNWKTQGFGANLACVAKSLKNGIIWPYKIVSRNASGLCPAGTTDFYSFVLGMNGHNGEDWAAYFKEKVYFPVIADTEWYAKSDVDDSGGIGIDVISKSPIAFDVLPQQAGSVAREIWKRTGKCHVKFRFHHAQMNVPANGSAVAPGFLIQYADSTGASGGNHVHWSMKFADEKGETIDKDNGYLGAVDFSRLFTNKFILDELATLKPTAATAPLKVEYQPTRLDRILAIINTLLSALKRR